MAKRRGTQAGFEPALDGAVFAEAYTVLTPEQRTQANDLITHRRRAVRGRVEAGVGIVR